MRESRPKTLPELLARQVDTGWGADPDDAVTRELVEALSTCDLIIRGVLEHVTSYDSISDTALWWPRYLNAEEPLVAEAQRRLAEHFGDVYVEALVDRAKYAVDQSARDSEHASECIRARARAEVGRDNLRRTVQSLLRFAPDGTPDWAIRDAERALADADPKRNDAPDPLAELRLLAEHMDGQAETWLRDRTNNPEYTETARENARGVVTGFRYAAEMVRKLAGRLSGVETAATGGEVDVRG